MSISGEAIGASSPTELDLGGSGRSVDELRRGLSGDRPVELVLHRREELPRERRTGVVVLLV
jgi:hypothetical protein